MISHSIHSSITPHLKLTSESTLKSNLFTFINFSIKLLYTSNKVTIDYIQNFFSSLKILNKSFPDYYFFSDSWIIDIIKDSAKENPNNNISLKNSQEINLLLKLVISKAFNKIYFAMREEHFQIFGFLVCISTYVETTDNEEEELDFKNIFKKMFMSKDYIATDNEVKKKFQQLYKLDYLNPEILSDKKFTILFDSIKKQIKISAKQPEKFDRLLLSNENLPLSRSLKLNQNFPRFSNQNMEYNDKDNVLSSVHDR